jgi:hypothetical protein
MANPQDVPRMVTELYEMSKEYLRQETVEPLKKVGLHAGLGLGGASLIAFGLFLSMWGVYFGSVALLPEGDWWRVLAKGITALIAFAGAGLIVWRMQKPGKREVVR